MTRSQSAGSGPADRLQRPQDAGPRDDDVDAAEVLGDLGEDLLLSVEVADVDGPSAGVAVTAQLRGLGLDALGGQVEERDVGAMGAQRPGQAGSQPAAGAGDRHGLSGQVEPHAVAPAAPIGSSALEELQDRGDEPLAVLEDAAVPGVRVDHELAVGDPLGQHAGLAGGDHDVVVAVGHERRLRDL